MLNRESSFEQGVIDGLIPFEFSDANLPECFQRLFDKGFFCSIGLVGVIVQQVIVAFDAVVDGLGGMQIEIFLEVVSTEITERRSCHSLITLTRMLQFSSVRIRLLLWWFAG